MAASQAARGGNTKKTPGVVYKKNKSGGLTPYKNQGRVYKAFKEGPKKKAR